MSQQSSGKRYIYVAVQILVSGGLLALIFFRTRPQEILVSLRSASLLPLLAAVGLFQVSIVIRTLRWSLFLRAQNYNHPFTYLLGLNYSASFFNMVLPTGFGGDFVRTLEIGRQDFDRVGSAAATVFLDRALGLVTLLAICIFALPFAFRAFPLRVALSILAIAVVGLLALILVLEGSLLRIIGPVLERVPGGRHLRNASESVIHLDRRVLIPAILTSLAYNGVLVTVHFLIGKAFHVQVGILYFAVFTPIVALSLITPAVQGLGVREEIYRLLLAQLGVANSLGILVGLSVYFVNLVTGLVGGAVYLLLVLRGLINRPSTSAQPEIS